MPGIAQDLSSKSHGVAEEIDVTFVHGYAVALHDSGYLLNDGESPRLDPQNLPGLHDVVGLRPAKTNP